MNKTFNLRLTEWDCYILRQALRLYVLRRYRTTLSNYFLFNYGHEKHLYKAYKDILALKHYVNWSTTTRKTLLNDLTQLSSYCKVHDLGIDAPYNPHLYRECIRKLRDSINKKEVYQR